MSFRPYICEGGNSVSLCSNLCREDLGRVSGLDQLLAEGEVVNTGSTYTQDMIPSGV